MAKASTRIPAIIKTYQLELLEDWQRGLGSAGAHSDRRISESELKSQTREFLQILEQAASSGGLSDLTGENWDAVREYLEGVSRSRANLGFTADQTASFIFSFKKPLFTRLQSEFAGKPETLAEEILYASELFDQLGLHTVKAYQKTREDIIHRQQQELLELSTPVVKLWEGVLALPMIGTLDSARTQVVMESLLQRIVDTGSEIAIIDITGVPTVDTLVAQHLLKTVTAIRLMGADCIISGVRPQIAQTIVHLGVDLQGVTTKSSLADALSLALKRTGFTIVKAQA